MEKEITFEKINGFEKLLDVVVDKKDRNDLAKLLEKGAPYYKCFTPNIYLAKINNIPIGIINLDIPTCKGYNIFFDILIFKEFRGQGLSTKIWRAFENKILPEYLKQSGRKCISATVEKSNTPSIKFLTKVGFRPLPEQIQKLLTSRRAIHHNEIRMVKCYR